MKYKVAVNVQFATTQTITVEAESEEAAIDKAESAALDMEADDFDDLLPHVAEAESCEPLGAL